MEKLEITGNTMSDIIQVWVYILYC